jgi:perosamine synthetase
MSSTIMNLANKIESVVRSIQNSSGHDQNFIALHEPSFTGNEWNYVKDCLDTGWVSSVGKYVDRFEMELASFVGVNYAVAVVNGTAALHVCLKLVGVEAGDEVLMPALTFVGTANAVSYCQAIPHFVDSERTTLGLDPHKLEAYLQELAEVRGNDCFNKKTGRRMKAVVPMHTFGHPVDMDPLLQVCEKFRLRLVEDAAESLGSYYKGKHTGSWGQASALSFNGNKIITTGGGGAILTNDPSIAKLAKHITTTAKLPHTWAYYHDRIGYNYRLPNINAALGCAQLEQLPKLIERKRALAEWYSKAFESVTEIAFFTEAPFARSNYWLNALLLKEEFAANRDELLGQLNRLGIMSRPAWTLMHKLPMYANCPRMDLSVAESIEKRLINIPSSPHLGDPYVQT